ncbi:MAG: hypothetical protein AUI18_02780 [Candidatus Rokubacteria bacterium 13_1_40CM_2_70_45]|nr:MAG: hypothetical protein AUI18_02780 [Candidatus Rokubacteria bacterium 13_1_40CM_2_70_45]
MPVRGHVGSDYERLRPEFRVIPNPWSPSERIMLITPIAMIRAVLRSGARDLHVVASSTGGFGIDLMIGAGAVASVEFAQIVLNEFGPAPNFRRYAESGRLRCLDHT